jgi:hypothetical protein
VVILSPEADCSVDGVRPVILFIIYGETALLLVPKFVMDGQDAELLR